MKVRVEVRASALNRADAMQRMGQYPPPSATEYEIPGLEVAGVVDKLGLSVSDWQIGDRVFGLLPGGGYAEQVLIHERMLMTIPENLTFEEAAVIPEVFFTEKLSLKPRPYRTAFYQKIGFKTPSL